MDPINLLVLFAFEINLFLSLFIVLRAARTKANISFEYTAVGITLWCLSMFFYRAVDSNMVVFWAKLLYYFPTFIPTAFLLFGLYFPNYKVSRKILYSIILANIVMAFLTLFDSAIIKSVDIIQGKERIIHFGWAYYYGYIIYIPFFFTASYIVLFRKYLKEGKLIRTQIIYILLGMTAASVPAMITNLNLPTFGNFELNWLGQLFTIFWISGVAYAIIKHRLMDIRLVVARTVEYSLLLVLLAGFYAVGFLAIGSLVVGQIVSSREELLISSILSIIIALSFQPLRRFFEKISNNVFYRFAYDSSELLSKCGKIMSSTLELDDLVSLILQEIMRQLKINASSMILIQNNSIIWSKNINIKEPTSFNSDKILNLINGAIGKSDQNELENILIFDELRESEVKVIMREYNISVVLPLLVENKPNGAILLAEKSSGDAYSTKDINVLKILAPEIAVAVRNSLSYNQIKRFNVTLEEEVKLATSELKKAYTRLKDLDTLKDEFVSLASHELRTPMTAIKYYIWILLQTKDINLSDKQRIYLERAYTSTDRLIRLVNDMLNVSRIEAGRIVLDLKEVDIKKLTQEVVVEIMPTAQKQKLQIIINDSDQIPTVLADPEKIKQVMINLIGNSLKFTPENGKITVIFENRGNMVFVTVSDTGTGIKPEDLPKLFTKFGMVAGNYLTKNNTQGTGLGLYITKSLIELHGGKISVASDGENKGSTFTFSLKPFQNQSKQNPIPPPAPQPQPVAVA